MSKKKQQNMVRTDYLENWIAFFRAHGSRAKAEAFCKIARDIGAPIDSEEIDRMEEIHTATQLRLFNGYDRQGSTPV